eukprot:sb/3465355/
MKLPKIIFVPCPNSHRFERREIEVYEDVKVGRSVARTRTSPDNAIFDCKVLSRSHAVMWYQDGHIWIKDTSSSNGTFVNGTRLSQGGEESEPCKIESGDKIQFGVNVMEAKKKEGGNPVTHGCIHAKTTVIIPEEAIPNPNYVTNDPMLSARSVSASSETLNGLDDDQDIMELHAAIKNACNRENLLHTRLQELEQRLGSAIEAAEIGWQCVFGLTRRAVLGEQPLYRHDHPINEARSSSIPGFSQIIKGFTSEEQGSRIHSLDGEFEGGVPPQINLFKVVLKSSKILGEIRISSYGVPVRLNLKIWIKDTSSSNGTFVNGTRLSQGGEESEPCKIESGDKIQFGVNVMEAKKKEGGNPVTHGCIHAKTTVIIPEEAIPNPNYVTNDPMLSARYVCRLSK